MNKSLIMLGMVFGSIIGGYIPTIFGAGMFSISSVIFSAVGGILGIWASYKLQE